MLSHWKRKGRPTRLNQNLYDEAVTATKSKTTKIYPLFCHSKDIIMGFKDLKKLFQKFHKQNFRLSVIVQVSTVLNRTVDRDWHFDNPCGSHFQSRVRWLPHSLSKRQSLSTTRVLFRTTFIRVITLNLLMKWLLGSNLWQLYWTVSLTNLLKIIASSTIGHLSMTLASQQCFLVHLLYLSCLLHGIFKCCQTQPKYHHRWIVFQ